MTIRKDRLVLVIIIIIITGLILSYLSEGRTDAQNLTGKIGVVVTIGPEVEFVKAVGGDKVDVTLMVPSTADVHTYEPLPSQLSKVASARMYVMLGSGVEFENNYLDKLKASNPSMLIINASKGVQYIPSSDEDEIVDPHIWTSPRNARIMVNNIYDGLVQADPGNQEYYKKNRDDYIHELDELDENTTQLLKGKNKPILIFHPAFSYYARDYNLTMIGVMVNDEEPSPQRIALMVDTTRQYNISVVFLEPQYDPKYMNTIASQIDGQVLLVSDLDEHYLENMKKVGIAFAQN
jgi:zinc transport system substrate-binding protein